MARRTIIRELYTLNARLGPKWFVRGLNYWRCLEYAWVLNNLHPSNNQKILDIGSSSCSPLTLFLAYQRRYVVHVTDIDNAVFGHTKHIGRLGLRGELEAGRFVIEQQDVTALTYQNESFDRIVAVSVIEHIPDDGDVRGVKEISRVLKRGGLALLTVPYHHRYKETYIDHGIYGRDYSGKPVFYQRHYDSIGIRKRLVEPSGLKVRQTEFFGETGLRFERIWDSLPWCYKVMLGWTMPVLSGLFIHRIDESSLERAMTACLVLEKPSA